MARRGRRETRSRMTRQSAVFQLPRIRPLTPPLSLPTRQGLRLVEDRRLYHPRGALRSARVFSGHPVKPLVARSPRFAVRRPGVPKAVGFAEPRKTLICVRRKQRKEVLHALARTGKGSGFGRKRRNNYSEVKC